MARNLVPLPEPPELAVLDHQDLRMAPPLYDLASLLNDSLYPPADLEGELVAGVLDSPDERLDYHRAAAQRTLKAVGTFLAFARRGDGRHRRLVRPTLERALAHLRQLPEMERLGLQINGLWQRLDSALATNEPPE